MFGFAFAPRDWAKCDGQLLSIADNTALFSLLGVQFGGDGRTTFALPDLRGRAPVSAGHGPGLSNYVLGQQVGGEAASLSVLNLPPHNHQAVATSTLVAEGAVADSQNPQGRMLAASQTYVSPQSAENRNMAPESITTSVQIGTAGGGQSVSRMQPSLAVNFCIAMVGIYPPRS